MLPIGPHPDETPEQRAERVRLLKEAIKSGRYEVPAERLAYALTTTDRWPMQRLSSQERKLRRQRYDRDRYQRYLEKKRDYNKLYMRAWRLRARTPHD